MQILEITQKVTDGKLVIDMPVYLNNQDVKVTISSNADENWTKFSLQQKLEILERFAGSDHYPNNKTEDYDVYEQ